MLKQDKEKSIPLKQLPADVYFRAKSTLTNLSDALKSRPNPDKQNSAPKTKTIHQTTLDYFLKPKKTLEEKQKQAETIQNTQKNQEIKPRVISNDDMAIKSRPITIKNGGALQRQYSSGPQFSSLPEKCDLDGPFAKVKVFDHDAPETPILDRPRKKLSFREPEIVGCARVKHETLPRRVVGKYKNSDGSKSGRRGRCNSLDYLDIELESQAMRIVRTVGQAFEVCHKLSVNEPTPEPLSDAEDSSSEQEPYGTPEPADIRDKGEKETKDMIRERDRDREIIREKEKERERDRDREDILATPDDSKTTVSTPAERPKRLDLLPPPPSSSRRSPAKNDSSPLVDTSTTTVPLAAHHELQLLREKLEQQAQQTRHASAQLIMLRDQLAAETAARVEAQTRTQQLLVHNRELLDHIAALVAHLQDSERTGTGMPSVTMVPQVSMQQYHHAPETGTPIDASDNLMGLGAPPSSPNRKTFHQQQNNNNNNNNLASPSVGNPGNNLQGNQGTTSGNSPNNSMFSFNFPTTEQIYSRLQIHPNPYHQFHQQHDLYPYNVFTNQNLVNNYNNLLQHPSPGQLAPSPIGFNRLSQQSSYSNSPILSRSDPEESDLGSDEPAFIRPLSQVGTLTTMDSDGRVRVIVPVNEDARGNSGNKDKKLGSSGGLPSMVTLRITDEGGNNITKTNTFITRPTSDKSVHKNRSAESIQRNAWARHTTK